jgi:hypothetical protein
MAKTKLRSVIQTTLAFPPPLPIEAEEASDLPLGKEVDDGYTTLTTTTTTTSTKVILALPMLTSYVT